MKTNRVNVIYKKGLWDDQFIIEEYLMVSRDLIFWEPVNNNYIKKQITLFIYEN